MRNIQYIPDEDQAISMAFRVLLKARLHGIRSISFVSLWLLRHST